MIDPIKKFLAKVSKQETISLVLILEKILKDDVKGLQIKKLTGSKDIFRIRKGKFRIIYRKNKTDCIIISIERRSESTYKDF